MSELHVDPIKTAIRIARRAHAGQLDKAGTPYIEHPLRVMDGMASDDVAGRIVAVLHDVVEDTEVTLDDLREYGFSQTILDAVAAITHPKAEPRRDYWHRVAANPLARRVKLVDIADNLSEERLGRLTDQAMVEGLRKKYRAALEILENVPPPPTLVTREVVMAIIALREAVGDRPFVIEPSLPQWQIGFTTDGQLMVRTEEDGEKMRALLRGLS